MDDFNDSKNNKGEINNPNTVLENILNKIKKLNTSNSNSKTNRKAILNRSQEFLAKYPQKGKKNQLENELWITFFYTRIVQLRELLDNTTESNENKIVAKIELKDICLKSISFYKKSIILSLYLSSNKKYQHEILLSKYYSRIGNLYRYLSQLKQNSPYFLDCAKSAYILSFKLNSKCSNSLYNIALLSFMEGNKLEAIFFYLLCLARKNTVSNARESILQLSMSILAKLERLYEKNTVKQYKIVYLTHRNEIWHFPSKRVQDSSPKKIEVQTDTKIHEDLVFYFTALSCIHFCGVSNKSYKFALKQFLSQLKIAVETNPALVTFYQLQQIFSILILNYRLNVSKEESNKDTNENICQILIEVFKIIVKTCLRKEPNKSLYSCLEFLYLILITLDWFVSVQDSICENLSNKFLYYFKLLSKSKNISKFYQLSKSYFSINKSAKFSKLISFSENLNYQLQISSIHKKHIYCCKDFCHIKEKYLIYVFYFYEAYFKLEFPFNFETLISNNFENDSEFDISQFEDSNISEISSSAENIRMKNFLVDTNVWIDHLDFCKKLSEVFEIIIYIPEIIPRELKHIITSKIKCQETIDNASKALKFIFAAVRNQNSNFKIGISSKPKSNEKIKSDKSNDDIILDYCLNYSKLYCENTSDDPLCILLTDDKNLLNKAKVLQIPALDSQSLYEWLGLD